jgi:hypothetical protein
VVQAGGVSSFRRSVERQAGPVLIVLARAPRWLPFTLVLACVVGGLLVTGPVGALLLLVVLLLLGLQLFFAWPALIAPQRALRASVLALLALVLVSRL